MLLPDKWYAFELSKGVALHHGHILQLGLGFGGLGKHKVEDELLTPKYDAFDHIE